MAKVIQFKGRTLSADEVYEISEVLNKSNGVIKLLSDEIGKRDVAIEALLKENAALRVRCWGLLDQLNRAKTRSWFNWWFG